MLYINFSPVVFQVRESETLQPMFVIIGAELQQACPGRRVVPGLNGLSELLVLVQCCRMMILSESSRAFKLPLLDLGRCRRMKGRSGFAKLHEERRNCQEIVESVLRRKEAPRAQN